MVKQRDLSDQIRKGQRHYKVHPGSFGHSDFTDLNAILGVEDDSGGGGQVYTQLDLAFLKAAKTGDADKLKELLREDPSVNLLDHFDRAAALHYIAAYDARPALRVILKRMDLNYLVRDRDGRLPSELAREVGNDEGMARLLMIKEMRQAKARGIDPCSLYKVSSRKPSR